MNIFVLGIKWIAATVRKKVTFGKVTGWLSEKAGKARIVVNEFQRIHQIEPL